MKILDYLSAKISSALDDQEPDLEAILNDIENFETTDNEEKEINDKLVKLQLKLLDKSASVLENIIDDFERLSNYEEK
jgi:hypothetical protein